MLNNVIGQVKHGELECTNRDHCKADCRGNRLREIKRILAEQDMFCANEELDAYVYYTCYLIGTTDPQTT